jgi:hypothetical protein
LLIVNHYQSLNAVYPSDESDHIQLLDDSAAKLVVDEVISCAEFDFPWSESTDVAICMQ